MPKPCLIRRRCLRALAALPALAGTGAARALPAPTGPVVLEVTGRVLAANHGLCACFDMPMLSALPQTAFRARTPWFTAPRHFTGPLLRDILVAAGARGTLLRLRALNDYRVDVPWDDAQRNDPIVARLLDGEPMAVRDKGPLFLIYPFDDRPELRSAVFYNRSAWQLRTIEVI